MLTQRHQPIMKYMGFSLARFFQRDDEILRDRPVRKASFLPVDSEVALDNAFALGNTETVLLFLHDPFCPISSSAYEQMERVEATIHLIDVSSHSGLGRGIQARTGIRQRAVSCRQCPCRAGCGRAGAWNSSRRCGWASA